MTVALIYNDTFVWQAGGFTINPFKPIVNSQQLRQDVTNDHQLTTWGLNLTSASPEEGPKLPKRMNKPCVIEVTQYNLIFVMDQTMQYLYHIANDTWTDILQTDICHITGDERYSCAIFGFNDIVISFLSLGGTICTAYYQLDSFTWGAIRGGEPLNDITEMKLFRAKNYDFVTLLASKWTNSSVIFQVRHNFD